MAVDSYNSMIATHARANGAALVDIHALTSDIAKYGYVSGGQRLTTEFLGGMFSLDGIHPTFTGHAIVANAFIQALNTNFAAGIPPVAIEGVSKVDPLVLEGQGHPPAPSSRRSIAAP